MLKATSFDFSLGSPKYIHPVNYLTIKRSKPSIISLFKVEAPEVSVKHIDGLKFAKKFNSDLILKSPFSGLSFEGKLSHLGPPTPPNKIASAALALEITLSVIGELFLSIETPPIRSSSTEISRLNLFETAKNNLLAS